MIGQCDCCGRDGELTKLIAFGIDTAACDACRGEEPERVGELTAAKNPSIGRAAASVVSMIDEYKNLGLGQGGKDELARLVERRLCRFWPRS